MKKYFLIFLLNICIVFFFYGIITAEGRTTTPEAPETIDEAETIGINVLGSFPNALKRVGQEALKVWRGFFEKLKGFWNSRIGPYLINFWNKIKSFLGKEVEKRKPEIEQELEREKKEMKTEIPKVSKSIWQRFKDLIRWWKED